MTATPIWHDLRTLTIEGQGWTDTLSPYDRLPARAAGKVPDPVWHLSQDSAGLCARFQTDAPALRARWTLRKEALAMVHMPATGVSGLDLYTRAGNTWRWLAIARPDHFPTSEAVLIDGLPVAAREYLLYLPLYNGVLSVELGVPKGYTLEPAPPAPAAAIPPSSAAGSTARSSTSASPATARWKNPSPSCWPSLTRLSMSSTAYLIWSPSKL